MLIGFLKFCLNQSVPYMLGRTNHGYCFFFFFLSFSFSCFSIFLVVFVVVGVLDLNLIVLFNCHF